MQFPESWLREFCNPPLSTSELADTLTMAGLEVEELRPVAPAFTQVVVGEIREVAQHPDADRLRVCQVDVGYGDWLNIVCGAPNARVGIKVPCALVGAELPPGEDGKPFRIKLGKLRGVESQGMLCSARELKLSDEQEGLLELSADAVVGQSIRDHLNLDDTLFTLKLTPNLAHCLSVLGVAREVSALTGVVLKSPEASVVPVSLDDRCLVKVTAPDLCGRFSGRVVRGVNAKAPTPDWIVNRLSRCGQRSVNVLVDISNYVMFEMGQPSHMFDLAKIRGALEVRWGRAGEQLKLLNGNTVAVDDTVGVIADGEQIESLAGIMGGDATAVTTDTLDVYLEAAFWHPKAIARRSRRFNLATDAGHRFERGVDPSQTVACIERITGLLLAICGGQAGPVDDAVLNLPVQRPVSLRVDRAARVIGMPLSAHDCLNALQRLGLPVSQSNDVLTVTPPTSRFDLQIEEDLIEEVARMVGYDRLPATPPTAPIVPKARSESTRSPFAARRALAARGYLETINFSFVEERWETELARNPNPIRLLNPIASHLSVMRSSLLGSLLQVLKFNVDRKADRVRVFELGRVFLRNADTQNSDTTVQGFDQPMRIAGLAYGPADALQWGVNSAVVDFFDVKGDVEALLSPMQPVFEASDHPAMHPGRCARVMLGGVEVGHVGELHPRWRQQQGLSQAPVLFELSLDAVLARQVPIFRPVARFQLVERDIAVTVPEAITHDQVMAAVSSAETGVQIKSAVLFDVYRPKQAAAGMSQGEKSLAVRLTLGADDATMTEAQIDAVIRSVLNQLTSQVGARLRA